MTGREAIETLEPLGDSPELAHALHRLGWFLWRRGRGAEAEPLLRRAIGMADRVQDVLVRAEATQSLALCLRQLGNGHEGELLMEEAFRLAKEAGDTANLMRAHNNLAITRFELQGPQAAIEVVREGLDLALRSGTIGAAAYIAATFAYMEQLLGRLSDAEERGRFAVSLGQRAGDEQIIGEALITLATSVLMRGRLDDAVALRDEAATVMAASQNPQAAGTVPLFDGYLALGRIDRGSAAERFAEAASEVRAYDLGSYPEIFPDCARVFMLLGDRDTAATYRDLEALTESVQSAVFAGNISGLLEPDPARAVELLTDAVAEYERLGMRIYAARAMVDLGRALVRAGQDPHDVLERARDILTACDARLFLFEVDEVTAD